MYKKIIKIVVGIFIMGTALWGYHYEPKYMYELTFLSNFTCGLVLVLDGIVNMIKDKSLPVILYQLVLPCIGTVFFTVVFKIFGWYDFNFSGSFFFLHALNPPLFLLTYLFGTSLEIKNKSDYIRRIFVAPLVIMAYVLFDLIRFIITGEFVYGLLPSDKINFISIPLIGIVLYLLMAFMSYGLQELKLYVQNR